VGGRESEMGLETITKRLRGGKIFMLWSKEQSFRHIDGGETHPAVLASSDLALK